MTRSKGLPISATASYRCSLRSCGPHKAAQATRNLASNCRRVLQKLDPGSFVDVLAEMARGTHGLARQEAIQLLGHATAPQSAVVLTSLIETAELWERRMIIQSLRRLKSPLAAKKIAPMLGSTDQSLREEVLSYLIDARASSVIEAVIQAISVESHDRLLPSYIDYFAACAKRHEGVTEALLPLLSRERIDWQDTRSLVKALATIAPKGHDATKRKLHELIEGNDTSSLAVQAAVTLRALGDKQGVSRLKRALDDKIRRRKREAALYEQRASLQFAIGDYSNAVSDYVKILDYSEGAAMTRRAYLGLLKGEARRNKIQNLVKYMKSSGMSPEEFVSLAEQDESFRAAMSHERIRTFLRQLAKERAPK